MASISFNADLPTFDFTKRSEEFCSKLKYFEEKFNLVNGVGLTIIGFKKTPSSILSRNTIQIPSWFLLKFEDIPEHLRARTSQLNDFYYLDEFNAWLKDQNLVSSGISKPSDYMRLRYIVQLLQDPELSEKAKDFALCHELAHLYFHQREKQRQWENANSLSGFVTELFWRFLAFSFSFCSSTGFAAILVQKLIEEERNADLLAVSVLGDASGGIYFFETKIAQNLFRRSRYLAGFEYITPEGNDRRDKLHPPLNERVRCLRSWI